MEQEFQREEGRFRLKEDLDRRRFEEEMRRQGEDFRRQQNFDPSGDQSGTDGNIRSRLSLPTRGFFTNSSSGSISDVEKFIDPTTLAVLGILLTLLATSLSLIKGN